MIPTLTIERDTARWVLVAHTDPAGDDQVSIYVDSDATDAHESLIGELERVIAALRTHPPAFRRIE